MEKTIAALMLATPRILRPYRRKAQAATAISGRDTAHANRAAVANAVLHLLSEWCPLLLYLGHMVRECNWLGENNGTGSRAQEVLQLSLCLLRRLRRGPCDTVLRYERTIMCTLLYNSKWHQDLPGQAHSEEFGEGMLSELVRDKARNRVLLLLRRWKTNTCYYRLVQVANEGGCKTLPTTWYTGCDNDGRDFWRQT